MMPFDPDKSGVRAQPDGSPVPVEAGTKSRHVTSRRCTLETRQTGGATSQVRVCSCAGACFASLPKSHPVNWEDLGRDDMV